MNITFFRALCFERIAKALLIALVVTSLPACESLPAPAPMDETSSGIGIRVKTRAPIKLFSNKPDRVFFIRLPEGGRSPYTTDQLIASNYLKGEYVYLLNVPPGRYAAVATSRTQSGSPFAPPTEGGVSVTLSVGRTNYTTFFSEELIKQTEVTVGPASIAFAGEFVIDTTVGLKGAEDVQLHYFRLLAPGAENRSGLAAIFSGDYHYRGSLHDVRKDQEATQRFLKKTREYLGEAGWCRMLQ